MPRYRPLWRSDSSRQIAMISPKTRTASRTANHHAVERAAITARLRLVASDLLPVCYAFDNLDVRTPYDMLMADRGGPRTSVGSAPAVGTSGINDPPPSTSTRPAGPSAADPQVISQP